MQLGRPLDPQAGSSARALTRFRRDLHARTSSAGGEYSSRRLVDQYNGAVLASAMPTDWHQIGGGVFAPRHQSTAAR